MEIDEFLDRLSNVKRGATGWAARCPGHADTENSLSVSLGDDLRILVKCFGPCPNPQHVVKKMGLTMRDLFHSTPAPSNGHARPLPAAASPSTAAGCTVAQYAAAKRLSAAFLHEQGVSDFPSYMGVPAIRIEYRGITGELVGVRFRLSLDKGAGAKRFTWRKGDKTALYGLWRLAEARAAGYIIIPEGESDAHTLWYHAIPAVGVPGVDNWKPAWAEHLTGIPTVYVIIEPGPGGQKFREKFSATPGLRERLRFVTLGEHKDPSALWLADPDHFLERWQAALDAAEVWTPGDVPASDTPPPTTGPYRIEGGRICRERNSLDGPVLVPLCNFEARVREELVLDDGAEPLRAFLIEGRLDTGEALASARVKATSFPSMAWVTEAWGLRAVVNAGGTTRDYLREAIQRLSPDAVSRRVYKHAGWREIDGQWMYLSASGAIGREAVEVDLGDELSRYRLPLVADDPVAAMRASLDLLTLGPLTVTAPLFAAVYRAPLASALTPDLTLWLEGVTGSFKSTLAGLFLSHYGAFDAAHLPGNFSSTPNALARRAFLLKDALFVVDEFVPTGFRAKDMEATAARLLRDQGNGAGRARLNTDLSEKATLYPRGLILATGEQHPDGQSLLARLLPLELRRAEVNVTALSAAQCTAERLPHALSGYLAWLAPQMPTFPQRLPATFQATRERAARDGDHGRVASATAHLWLGLSAAMDYARDIGACTATEAEILEGQCWEAFVAIGRGHAGLVEEERPGRLFLRVLMSLLSQDRAALIPRDGSLGRAPLGRELLGWIDVDALYLIPEASLRAVAKFCMEAQQPFPIKRERLLRDFAQDGISERGQDRHTVSVRINGKVERVLKLHRAKAEALAGGEFAGAYPAVAAVAGYGG